jgi:hypothetical protein
LIGADRTKPSATSPSQPTGVGLRILIQGAHDPSASEQATKPDSKPAGDNSQIDRKPASLPRMLAVIALTSADLALLGWCVHHALTHQHALHSSGIVGCIVSALLAALCGCAAVLMIARGE